MSKSQEALKAADESRKNKFTNLLQKVGTNNAPEQPQPATKEQAAEQAPQEISEPSQQNIEQNKKSEDHSTQSTVEQPIDQNLESSQPTPAGDASNQEEHPKMSEQKSSNQSNETHMTHENKQKFKARASSHTARPISYPTTQFFKPVPIQSGIIFPLAIVSALSLSIISLVLSGIISLEIRSLKISAPILFQSIEDQKIKIDNLQKAFAALKSDNDEETIKVSEKLKNLLNASKKLQDDLTKLKAESNSVHTRVDSLESNNKKMLGKFTDLNDDIKKLKQPQQPSQQP